MLFSCGSQASLLIPPVIISTDQEYTGDSLAFYPELLRVKVAVLHLIVLVTLGVTETLNTLIGSHVFEAVFHVETPVLHLLTQEPEVRVNCSAH